MCIHEDITYMYHENYVCVHALYYMYNENYVCVCVHIYNKKMCEYIYIMSCTICITRAMYICVYIYYKLYIYVLLLVVLYMQYSTCELRLWTLRDLAHEHTRGHASGIQENTFY